MYRTKNRMESLQATVERYNEEIRELKSQLSFYISSYLFQPEFDPQQAYFDLQQIRRELHDLKAVLSQQSRTESWFNQLFNGVGALSRFADENVANYIIFGCQAQMSSNDYLISAYKAEIEQLKRRLIRQEDRNFSQVLKLQSLEKIVLQRDVTAQEVKAIEDEVGRVVFRLKDENTALRRQIEAIQQRSAQKSVSPRETILSASALIEYFATETSCPSPQQLKLVKRMHDSCQEHSKQQRDRLTAINQELQDELAIERRKQPTPALDCSVCKYKRQITQYREIIDCLREEISVLKRELRFCRK